MILPPPQYSVELIAENGKHSYRVRHQVLPRGSEAPVFEEIIYPGVTGVLGIISKPALVPWAKRVALDKMRQVLLKGVETDTMLLVNAKNVDSWIAEAKAIPDQLKDDAAALGTEAHVYIDKFVKGDPLGPIPDAILEPVSAFADWWKRSGYRFVAGDTKVASRRHGFGGSLDALAEKNGKLVLLDWKTSKAIYDEYALQVAAYCYAFTEMYGVPVHSAVCVRFRKPGVDGPAFEALEVRDVKASFEAFLAAKHLQDAMKNEHFIRPPKILKPKKEKIKCPK